MYRHVFRDYSHPHLNPSMLLFQLQMPSCPGCPCPFEEPTILDALEAVEFNDFAFYATSFDIESLIADWRLPHSTQDWLQRYRQRLEVIFHFDPWQYVPWSRVSLHIFQIWEWTSIYEKKDLQLIIRIPIVGWLTMTYKPYLDPSTLGIQ